MRSVKIREISATVIEAAAERNEPLAITNNNVVCGIVIPVSPRWVQDVVHQSLSRIVHSIGMGEKELDNGEPFIGLDQAVADPPTAPTAPPLRRVSIREVSGAVIAEASEPFAITSDREVRGVVIPVSRRWLCEVVDANLSRVLNSIRMGEREIAAEPFVTLDEAVDDDTPVLASR